MLTASEAPEVKRRALEAGATDFLAKPVDPSELTLRVGDALALKAHQDRLERQAEALEEQVRTRTAALEAANVEILYRLARAAEYRDNDTGRHVMRVGRYAELIAQKMGLDSDFVSLIAKAAPLHDVGKIGVPDAILKKPGKLTPEEFEIMQRHCTHGKRIFETTTGPEAATYREHSTTGFEILGGVASPLIAMAARIALSHHERWDGGGYPLALAGEDIPLEARITAVADVFDALSHRRCYKPAFPLDRCFEILQSERGRHFDPRVLDAFIEGRPEVATIQMQLADLD